MNHTITKIWIHAMWSTKNRQAIIKPNYDQMLYSFINTQFAENGCIVKAINGMPDHIHCLFLMNNKKSLSDIIKSVKGASSHYVNEQNFIKEKFLWQDGYFAFSVSESNIEKTVEYIKNQKYFHQKRTYLEEIEEYIKLLNINIQSD
jgi:REP element-mobilizing transposase RayT